MNKAELTAHVATQTTVPKATSDSVVGTVFTAIGEALARLLGGPKECRGTSPLQPLFHRVRTTP